MLKACAYSCTDFLMRHTNIASSRRQIYLYGFELLLSTLTSACGCFVEGTMPKHMNCALLVQISLFSLLGLLQRY